MKLFSKKTLKGNVVIEMSVVFPAVLMVVVTLLVVIIFCFYQSHMKIRNESELFSADYDYTEVFLETKGQVKGASHWDDMFVSRSIKTMFSTNSVIMNERVTMLFSKKLQLLRGSYLESDIYSVNEMSYSDIMLVIKAMSQGELQ